jgi:ParB family chromosome partitioning protein
MLDRPDVALCALLHCLVQRLLCDDFDMPRTAVRLVVNAPDVGLVGKGDSTLAECKASRVVAEARRQWMERLPADRKQLLGWLVGLDDAERARLLALCVALTLNDVREGEGGEPLDELATALKLDMADWWEATAAGYFQRVTKQAILAAIAEGAGAEAARRVKGVSKGELARVGERDLLGRRWLPAPLRPATRTEP